jgi:S-adenosylmethionine:tRNA ribosyltransferase-isomerase
MSLRSAEGGRHPEGAFKPATTPRPARDVRILVADGAAQTLRVVPSRRLPELFGPGDLLVVNDAATLPASIPARTEAGAAVEIRLLSSRARDGRRWTAALLGEGDYRTPTEHRPPPAAVAPGDRLHAGEAGAAGATGASVVATVLEVHPASPRLVDVELGVAGGDLAGLWAALYRVGRPVQYAHVPEPLALWDVQNLYAGRPWAVEMPSAGRILRAETLLALRRRGVEVAALTHAAGLSAVGDPAIDARLPLPERFEIPEATWRAVERARRVIAIGTSAARALEGATRACRCEGVTDLLLGPSTRRLAVDAVLTGVHEVGTSHHRLLGAFVDARFLERAQARAEQEQLLGHEMGDALLVWGKPREKLGARPVARHVLSSSPGVRAMRC